MRQRWEGMPPGGTWRRGSEDGSISEDGDVTQDKAPEDYIGSCTDSRDPIP